MFDIPKIGLPPIDPSIAANWNPNDQVVIIGAGASGLSAAYTLQYLKVPFVLLEASNRHGGRVQRNEDFLGKTGIALDTGAEWIHTANDASVLKEPLLVEEDRKEIETFLLEETIEYQPQKWSAYNLWFRKLLPVNWMKHVYKEHKFKTQTWSQYLDKYLYRHVKDHIEYDAVVKEIDYSSPDCIKITLKNSQKQYSAAKVICTVPVSILKEGDIQFTPELPKAKQDALDKTEMKPGFKVAIEFKKRFWEPDVFYDRSFLSMLVYLVYHILSERTYFDALFNKGVPDKHVLGVYCYGKLAEDLVKYSDDEIFKTIMKRLDKIFDGQASSSYMQHYVKNWNSEPFIRGAFSNQWHSKLMEREFAHKPLAKDRIFFAGEFVGGKYGPTVHGCCLTGRRAALNAVGTEYSI